MNTPSHPTEAKNTGRLWHGKPGLDISAEARAAGLVRTCGAAPRPGGKRTLPCRKLAMRNGRCELHGGRSTGPRTAEGLARARRASWKHGRRSAEAIERNRKASAFLAVVDESLAAMNAGLLTPEMAGEFLARMEQVAPSNGGH